MSEINVTTRDFTLDMVDNMSIHDIISCTHYNEFSFMIEKISENEYRLTGATKNGTIDKKRAFTIKVPDVKKIKKEILGFSGGLLLTIPTYHAANILTTYKIKTDDLKKSNFLCAICFGRSKGAFICSSAICNIFYCLYDTFSIGCLTDTTKLLSYNNNLGVAAEKWLCENGFKHGSYKQDKSQKIDVIDINLHRFQVKASCYLQGVTSKGASYSVTNGTII